MRRAITALAQGTALLGGFVLLALILMTTVSVAGREVGLGEINGNYEILEAGIAFAIFSFFPICQLHSAHATVDVVTSGLRPRALAWLKAFWEIVLAAVIVLIAWRLEGGLERYLRNGETTLFLQFPVWWAFGASFAAACVAAIVSVYCALARIVEAGTGRAILPSEF
jgi:TRAP-type C4-dicarboxylate transport system permease small subunit